MIDPRVRVSPGFPQDRVCIDAASFMGGGAEITWSGSSSERVPETGRRGGF